MTDTAVRDPAPASTTTPPRPRADRPARAELSAMHDLYDLVDEFATAFRGRVQSVSGTRARARVRGAAEGYAAEVLKGLLEPTTPGDTE